MGSGEEAADGASRHPQKVRPAGGPTPLLRAALGDVREVAGEGDGVHFWLPTPIRNFLLPASPAEVLLCYEHEEL